ncbi:MAG TPA: pyridoxamine 5'-phosphate oxidase family protein [Albitalea sp.]|nr:pyridoxamine 5'-phosphate oxidase family protein [Albitalea sp.]
MKIAAQRSEELTRITRLIDGMSVAMLTHPGHDGSLLARPMAPLELDEDGALWFFVDRDTEDAQLLHNVNLAFVDAAHSIFVSMSGHGEIVANRARVEAMWTPLARPWFPQGAQSGNIGLLKFVPHHIEYWDAPHSRVVRLLALAASMVTGKPVGQGEHHSMTRLAAEPFDRVPTQGSS